MSKMKEYSPSIRELEDFMDKNVRPYLASHNGNLEIVDFKKGVLKLKLLGACVNCPAAEETLDKKIIKLLKEEFPEIKEVKSIKGVSDKLMSQAKDILKKRRKNESD